MKLFNKLQILNIMFITTQHGERYQALKKNKGKIQNCTEK